MPLAAFQCADSDRAQHEMLAAIDRFRSAGVRVVGVIEERDPAIVAACSAGALRDISSLQSHNIYLDTPRADTSCRIDATGVDAACAALLAQIPAADVVLLSKFGKLEAAGGGLFPALQAALAAGKPVITAVSEKHRDAWRDFAPAATVLATADEALAWFAQTRGRRAGDQENGTTMPS